MYSYTVVQCWISVSVGLPGFSTLLGGEAEVHVQFWGLRHLQVAPGATLVKESAYLDCATMP